LYNNSKFGGSVISKTETNGDGNKGRNQETEGESTTKSSSSTATSAANKTVPLPVSMLEIMLDIMEKATAFDAIITLDQAEHLISKRLPQLYHMYPVKGKKSGVVTLRHVLYDVYQYWVSKRGKLKRPLLRRFWPVTSLDDTNPHLVFRPREKEKYKLRKKRQNDMDAYRKLQQLRNDFSQVRQLLGLVQQREELNRSLVLLQKEWFEQKLYDAVDTSGLCRVSQDLDRKELDQLMQVEKYYDVQDGSGPVGSGSWKKKRGRRGSQQQQQQPGAGSRGASRSTSPMPDLVSTTFGQSMDGRSAALGMEYRHGSMVPTRGFAQPGVESSKMPTVIAGENNGEPAPSFLQPLSTRESYATSWEGATPHVTTIVDGKPLPTFRFRHRPRVGRGGRLCIDRVPLPADPNVPPTNFFRAGTGPSMSLQPKERLLDLLPPQINKDSISRSIEDICLSALQEDYDAHTIGPSNNSVAASMAGLADGDENDGAAVIVKMKDWLNTDDQVWGEERFAVGPI
jgi:enhancer of polycomb-like protein